MREIVDAEAVGRLFQLLAVIGPAAGLLVGAALGARRKRPGRLALAGLLIGMAGTANWLLWRVYNLITDSLGLDTVRNLVVNVILFLIVGAAVGAGIGAVRGRGAVDPEEDGTVAERPR